MNQNDVTPAQEISVGQILRQEREQQQLSLEQAAQQLNLRVEVLRSLEADQPDNSILPTFMRGYLKAYARFLKLPVQPLLQQFEQQHQVKSAPVKQMRTFSNRSARQRTEKRFMWLTWLIVSVILLSLAVWFWQSARNSDLNVDDVLVSQTGNSQLSQTTALTLTTEVVVPTPEPTAEVGNEPVAEQDSGNVSSEQLVAELAQLPVTAQQQLLELSQPAVEEPATTESFGDSRNAGLDVLKMTFTDNCWIDVVDANGDRIAYGTKQAGYVMELNAKAPFVITLGNPGVVSIELNQQSFDMSHFPGNRVAKFTLPGQPD
jgi:cytoskeleton protein RodZ